MPELSRTPTRPARRVLVLSLRVLMLLIALIAVWLAWVTNRARTQAEVVRELQARNAQVFFDYQTEDNLTGAERQKRMKAPPPGPRWLRRVVGDEYFRRVTRVSWYMDRRPPPRKLDSSFKGPRPEDDFVRKLASLPGLVSFSVMRSEVSDLGLANVARMQDLEMLLVAGCPNVTDADFAHVQGLRKLNYVTFQECEIGDRTLAYLVNLPGLEILKVRGGHITDAGLAQVRSMASLNTLWLENLAITDTGLAHLRGLSNLTTLSVDNPTITNTGLAHLATLRNLDALFLRNAQITDEGLAELVKLKRLRLLVLSPGGQLLTNRALESIRSLPELVSLTIANPRRTGTRFTDEAVLQLVQSLPMLRSLTLEPTNLDPAFVAQLKQARLGLQVATPRRLTTRPPPRPTH